MSMQNDNSGRGDPHLSKEEKAVLEIGKAVIAVIRKVWIIVTAPDDDQGNS